jgi:histidine phosphotransfer protein HptB
MPDDVIDRGVLAELQSTAGPEFVAELIGTFLQETPNLLGQLRTASTKGDVEGFRRAAHSLKSNAQTFGATQLAALARELENNPLAASPSDTASAVAALEAEYAQAAATLTTLKG